MAQPTHPTRRTNSAFPGLSSPAAGFEQPFELLSACHERVERSLDLLERLLARWQATGCDAAVASAARDVARYFSIAAPHHHEDEERHILPRLRASQHPSWHAAAKQIEADHAHFRALWRLILPGLEALAAQQPPAQAEPLLQAAKEFAQRHATHLQLENQLAFPAAASVCDAAALHHMGTDMAHRRGVTPKTS